MMWMLPQMVTMVTMDTEKKNKFFKNRQLLSIFYLLIMNLRIVFGIIYVFLYYLIIRKGLLI